MPTIMESLKNKKAVIIGGSRGIGKAIAKAYLQNGAEVYLLARDAEELSATAQELGAFGMVKSLPIDVSVPVEMEHAAREVLKAFDKIDILVNAAAVYGPIGPVTEVAPEEWKQAIEVNLFGPFLSVHYFAPHMTQKQGTIINFVGGGEGPFPRFTSYVSSKGGIARFTEAIAEEFKEKGIDVNAIAPGAVNTKLLDDLLKAGPEKAGKETYEKFLKQKESGGTPPEKAAALCVFLASNEARGITGKVISAVWDVYEDFPKHRKEMDGSDVYTMRRVRPEWRGLDFGERKEGQ